MRCPNAQDLSSYYDRELSPAQSRQISRHVDACASCAAILAAYADTARTIREAPLPEISNWLINRWAEARRMSQDRALRRFAGVLTAAAAALLLTATIFHPAQSQPNLPAIGEWETVALGGDILPDSESRAAARWMAVDLSLSSRERP